MPVEFKLPELGENIEKGDVARVLVKVGDTVVKDQPLMELETDKATIEVPATVAGTITEVRVKAGEKAAVGQVVLVIDDAAGGAAAASKAAEPPAKAEQAEAAPAPKAEAAADTDTRAAQADEAPASRPAPVVDISRGRATSQAPAALVRSEAAQVPAAPSTRRYARELGVDIGEVPGTGPGGRIGQADVKDHVKLLLAGGGGARRTAPLPDFSKWGDIDVQSMSNIRRKTAEHLATGWNAIPLVTQFDKADITALEAFRQAYGKRVEKAGGKLTVTAILVKVVALALDRFPQFATSVDMANQAIVYKQYRHVGIAVDTPNGLLVPVIRDVDRKTIAEIAADLATVSQKARDKKLSLDDMSGGVFTISNLGGIGGTAFTPLVNAPEVAILGVSRGTTEPVFRDGEFEAREVLPLSLSYDHRVIDGADGARFLRFIAEALEQPLTAFL
ncbi:MAG: branched-chain alpha-keto acid dehydrogenase subunit E2 [Acidobacteria bacterium SCN 69-37]|nr:MAG: branched-chain alpha-keto acid dehydrogenase subunit E2 [Acidobacteria bacterium SCN 69-37]